MGLVCEELLQLLDDGLPPIPHLLAQALREQEARLQEHDDVVANLSGAWVRNVVRVQRPSLEQRAVLAHPHDRFRGVALDELQCIHLVSVGLALAELGLGATLVGVREVRGLWGGRIAHVIMLIDGMNGVNHLDPRASDFDLERCGDRSRRR